MKIKKMTATFGRLEQATLTPSEGLTVISAPNEGGKSTWAGFLKAMLYGIETKERDKAGFLADKSRYQPWSGTPMWGELELEWEGRDITLRRAAGKSGPMQNFEGVYTASGDPIPGLTGANAGQTITGVGKEVFVRTALVGQNGTAVTHVPELESRIAALATAGEEGVSCSAAQRVLKDWKNRRRANRAIGQIPELERELARVEGDLSELAAARRDKTEAEGRVKLLEEEKRELLGEAEIHRRLAQKELNRRCGQAMESLLQAERELEQMPEPDPAFAGLTAQQARALARQREEERTTRQAEWDGRRRELDARRSRLWRGITLAAPVLGLIGLALIVTGFVIKLYALCGAGFGCLAAAVVTMMMLAGRMGKVERALSALQQEKPAGDEDDITEEAAENYVQWLLQKEQLEGEVRHCRERLDDLRAQGAREYDTLELLHAPLRSADQTAARLREVEDGLFRWQSRLDRAIGALRTDPLTLESRRDQLRGQIRERTHELEAVELAMEGLEQADSLLRERFSPALNEEAAAIFDRLTEGRYSRLTLSSDFSAQAAEGGSPRLRSALYLSAGTADQLYLAVRLAMCRLTLPGVPILLDDALSAFDDRRAELALDCLRELASERQILLFTCHSREARWAEEQGVPVIWME